MASQWNDLLTIAVDLINQVNRDYQVIDHWTLGGGTAMRLQIDHRESHDVDIFLDDHQLLPYLDPSRQDFNFAIAPSGYHTDGTGFQRIVFDHIGEIDFIVSSALTTEPEFKQIIDGREVLLETVVEIIRKKVVYRGTHISSATFSISPPPVERNAAASLRRFRSTNPKSSWQSLASATVIADLLKPSYPIFKSKLAMKT